jgi:zinc/manganese transport system permease protein
MTETMSSPLDYSFMRHAIAGGVALALASAPLGVFLVLRRMSLTGEAMAHAVLPGVAVGFLIAGLSLPALAFGGLIAGLTVALFAASLSRLTRLREETALAGLYLVALALGAVILSAGGRPLDLLHILFGSILALDRASVLMLATLASFVLIAVAALYRVLVMDTLDPSHFRVVSGLGASVSAVFLALVAATLVAGFQAMGTLMGAALMVLPAAGARLWTDRLPTMIVVASFAGVASVLSGLAAAYAYAWPAGPSVALVAGAFFLLSTVFGRSGGYLSQRAWRRHLEA